MEARRSPNFFYIKPEKARARSLKPEPDPSPKIVGPTQPYLFYLESRSEYLFFTVHKRVFARNVTKRNAKTD